MDGFLALGVDALSPLGGTPADEDKAREMIGTLDRVETLARYAAATTACRCRPRTCPGSPPPSSCTDLAWGQTIAFLKKNLS